jgi:trimethylamine:corrinoid methyltransferase-like protein
MRYWEPAAEDDLEKMHEAACRLLAELGVRIHDKQALSALQRAGTASRCSAASYELLVLHNEILRTLTRVRHGLEVNDETLAVDVQLEAGIRGDYMLHPHTLRTIRSAGRFIHKDLFDSTGVRSAYQDPLARAHERCKTILRDHQPDVSADERRAIDEVIARFQRG